MRLTARTVAGRRKRSPPIATSIRPSASDRDRRRLGAVGGDDAAAVGGDEQPAEAAVGLADGEQRPSGPSALSTVQTRSKRPAPVDRAFDPVGTVGRGGAVGARSGSAAGGEQQEGERARRLMRAFSYHFRAGKSAFEPRAPAVPIGRPNRASKRRSCSVVAAHALGGERDAALQRGEALARCWRGSRATIASTRPSRQLDQADPRRLGAVDARRR